MRLWPFFSYYGGKWKTARLYPAPSYKRLVEPFAGAAGYALHYPGKEVVLFDVNPVIAGLWKYLITTSEEEIRSLPVEITDLREMKLTQEQRWLIGFWVNKGAVAPRNVPTKWMKDRPGQSGFWGKAVRGTVASQLKYIRHWKVFNKSYELAKNSESTWFVDPPYQSDAGRHYTHSEVDYVALGEWCLSRKGQVIACDVKGSDWLPFVPLAAVSVAAGKHRSRKFSTEVVYHKCENERGLF